MEDLIEDFAELEDRFEDVIEPRLDELRDQLESALDLRLNGSDWMAT